MSRSLVVKAGSLDSLNRCTRCGCSPCARQIRCTELMLTPTALAIAAAVQCVASLGGSLLVSVTTRSITEVASGGIKGESDSCAHPADSHTQQATGIPCRGQPLDLIH